MLSFISLLAQLVFLTAALPEVGFTEDPEAFRATMKEQSERLMGCWMMVREYNPSPSQPPSLSLIKHCMRRLTRQDSRLKITEFAGKNTAPAKRLQDVLTEEEIAFPHNGSEVGEVDQILLEYIDKFEKEVGGFEAGKAEMREKVEEKEKKQKYYLGIIPANKFTLLLLLISIGVFLLLLCSCCGYLQRKNDKKQQQRKQQSEKMELYRVSKQQANNTIKKLLKTKKT